MALGVFDDFMKDDLPPGSTPLELSECAPEVLVILQWRKWHYCTCHISLAVC